MRRFAAFGVTIILLSVTLGFGAGLKAAEAERQMRRVVYRGGDIITAIDGQPVTARDDLTLYLESHTLPGDTVTLTIVRDGTMQDITVTVGEFTGY